MNVIRLIFLSLAAAGILLLPMTALNISHFGQIHIERFREITLLIYFCLMMFALLRKTPSSFVKKWSQTICNTTESKHFFPIMAGSMLVLYILAALTQHLSFNTYSHDFSMIDEALYNSHRARFMFSPVLGRSFFGEHFSPILILLIPLHFIFNTPYLLVLIQPIALWLSMLVLRKILVRENLPAGIVNLTCLIYLNNPIMVSTLNYIFHMECFLPLIIFAVFLYQREGAMLKYWAAILLALTVKEDVGLYLLGFSAYLIIVERKRRLGLITAVISLIWFIIALKVVIPCFAGDTHYKYLSRWGHWGETPPGILTGFLQHPLTFMKALFSKQYLWLFSCLLFMPFYRKWSWLIFVIPWVINSTSSFSLQSKMSLYYGIPVLTFAVIGSIIGFKTTTFKTLSQSRLAPCLVCLAVILNISYLRYPPVPRERLQILRELRNIPADKTIQAMSCFYPVLSYDREKNLIEPGENLKAEYVILRTDSTTWPFTEDQAKVIAREAIESGEYENVSGVKGFFILHHVQ